MFVNVTLVMVFDISVCNEIINETFEELCELGLTLESLVESSVEDVMWFLRLVGGQMILDHTDNMNFPEVFLDELGMLMKNIFLILILNGSSNFIHSTNFNFTDIRFIIIIGIIQKTFKIVILCNKMNNKTGGKSQLVTHMS